MQKFFDKFRGREASFKPQTKVKNFIKNFEENFGVGVKVYVKTSNVPAKGDRTLASVRPDSFKGSPSDVSCKMSDKVGNVEARFMKDMGVKIQVLNSDGSLCDDDKTLGELQREQYS